MKRTSSYLLITAILISLLSVCAWAAETAEPNAVNQPDLRVTVSDVNPAYAALGVKFTKPAADCMTTAESTVASLEEAGDYLREQMENRVTEVMITVTNYPVYSNAEEYDAWIAELKANWTVILYDAFEHTGVSTQGDYIMRHYGKSTGSIGHDGISTATFSYTIIYDTTLEQENTVGEKIDELFAEWDEDSGFYDMSDYEKVCTIYDYICANVVYDYTNLNDEEYTLKYSAYAALINGTAVCQGYANLFYRMVLEADIDNRIVVGMGNGGYHGWNIVELGEQYYYVDSTWDAGRTNYRWFLLGSDAFHTDHTPDADFLTEEFLAEFPVSKEDYALTYIANGTCGENLTWTLSNSYELTISGEGEMYDYGRFSDFAPWYDYVDSITKIVIDKNVTSIGSNAFTGCENMTVITIPESVTTIGDDAFAACRSMTGITLPASVTRIGDFAFTNCTFLESIVIPDGVTSISYCMFSGCISLTNVVIPASVTNIEDSAFYDCASLTAICYTGTEEQWNAIEISTEEGPFPDVTVIHNWNPGTGLQTDENGIWRYYVDGQAADYTGLVTHIDGKTYYVFKGVVPMDYVGLFSHTDGKIYYIYYGVAQKNYVGLYAHTNGVVYYIDKGTVSSTYTGLYAHTDGNTYYVYKGVIPTSYIGLCYHTDGKTYYIYKGVAVSSYTGLYSHTNGMVYYINEGVIDPNFVGLYTHTTGATYYVYNGVVMTNYVGLYNHTDGKVYYVYNGVLVPSYEGFYFHSDGKLYYMYEGVIAVNYTGLALHSDGKLYYVVNGVFDPTYNGTATDKNGTEYEVVNGIAQPTEENLLLDRAVLFDALTWLVNAANYQG